VQSHPQNLHSLPQRLSGATDPILRRALAAYRNSESASNALVAEKVRLLAHYDVPGIQNIVALCHWGRSGSILLPSYLDGHEDIIALPNLTGELIYPFCQVYATLSVWDKLIVYPIYSAALKGGAADLFLANNPAGDYATAPEHFYAAIRALHAMYGERPPAWLQPRSRFVQFLHVAYAIANGQQPRGPCPAIIYAQHWFSQELASRFAMDFPQGRFLHTVRDPISALNSWFDMHLSWQFGDRWWSATEYAFPAYDAMRDLLRWDRPHLGMEQRSWALRFEDMHLMLHETMRGVADWLGITYQPSLLESTLNRRPYIVSKDGRSWRGANQLSARRRCNYLHHCDRALLFALFYDDFVAWGYPVPGAFQFRWLRLATIFACALVPMKIELINARIVMASQAVPALRSGRLLFGCTAPLQLMLRRVRMMVLLLSEGVKRITGHVRTLPLLQVATDAPEVEQPGPAPHVAVNFRRARPRLA
jgi:hypothetical protein